MELKGQRQKCHTDGFYKIAFPSESDASEMINTQYSDRKVPEVPTVKCNCG